MPEPQKPTDEGNVMPGLSKPDRDMKPIAVRRILEAGFRDGVDDHHAAVIISLCKRLENSDRNNDRLKADWERLDQEIPERTEQASREKFLWEEHQKHETEIISLKAEVKQTTEAAKLAIEAALGEVERLTTDNADILHETEYFRGLLKLGNKAMEIAASSDLTIARTIELESENKRLTADNAAMLDGLQLGDFDLQIELLQRGDHPGQVLLDRLEKLEAVPEAAKNKRDNIGTDQDRKLNESLEKLDDLDKP